MNIQMIPDDHDGAAELEVRPDEKVAVVLPGEVPVIAWVMASVIASVMALDARAVDQSAAFAGLEAGQRGHRDTAARGAVEPNHGCAAFRCPGACSV
ncbi:hypothetical protein ACFVW1_40250 [Streptomyces olivochromogenes]|uniref:hypothetical protein n=1 Tax=Streptomyces olivochromogenes TaxID=1963 RepID=UPI0036D9DDA0